MPSPAPTAAPTADAAPAAASPADRLHAHVHGLLCERENLLPGQFRTVASPVRRGGAACGTQFTLLGPRSVRLTAVHDAARGLLFVFDAAGRRVEKRAARV